MKTKELFVSHITGNKPNELNYGSTIFKYGEERTITSKFIIDVVEKDIKKTHNCTFVTILFFHAVESEEEEEVTYTLTRGRV